MNIKGVLLDKYQLENYLAKLASDNTLKNKSDKNTYPIPRVKENFEYITNVYNILTEHLKLGIPIHPAGEWILDNYYIVEKTVKTVIKDMPLKKYTSFLGLENGNYKGFARVYVLASEIVAYTDAVIDRNNLSNVLKEFPNKYDAFCILGENGAGKSNFLDSIKYFYEKLTSQKCFSNNVFFKEA